MPPAPVSFGVSALSGEISNNPTGIDFSKTGKPVIFVAQQDGSIYRYEVERKPDGPDADSTDDFVVTDTVLIDVIAKKTQNFDDNGALNATAKRQVTGMMVDKDAAGNDVLYVTSSDWRIAVGEDSGLDTNSSQVHRLTLDSKTGDVISNVALIRGLPRSEENHAVNGIDLGVDAKTGDVYLWMAIGGITNKGAPGNNFAGTTDFAWSGAVAKVNLTKLETFDVRTDANGEKFVLDMPTLDDPSRPNVKLGKLGIKNLDADPNFTLDDNGPKNGKLQPDWAGGNDGLNQAKITSHVLVSKNGELKLVKSPIDLHAPGFRNAYDVLAMEDGEVFTWDNGPNGGWGGQPLSFQDGQVVDDWKTDLATNEFNETGSNGFGDQLHYLGRSSDDHGPYGGHAVPLRAAKEALDAAFKANGSYKGATPGTPIKAGGKQLFANEAEAREYLASLLIIYQNQGGTWKDVTAKTGLPADLHSVLSGYDWTHPGTSISDPLKFYNGGSVMDGTPFSPESQLLDDKADGSLFTAPESTNGLSEYTAGYFGGALQGTIVAASWDEVIYWVKPQDKDSDGRPDAAKVVHTEVNPGSNPLAVAAFGDAGVPGAQIDKNGDGVDDFAGIVVAAAHGADTVTFYVPGGQGPVASDDLDGDGLDNIGDSHVGDPLNGRGVVVGAGAKARWDFEPNNPGSTPAGAVPPGDSIAGDIGINAVWRNGKLPAVDNGGDRKAGLYDGGVFNLGGASSFVSIDRAHDGKAHGKSNSQQDVLGIGFTAPGNSEVTVITEMVNIFDYSLNTDAPARKWNGGEKVGLMVGPGDQLNFAMASIAAVKKKGEVKYGVQLLVDKNDKASSTFTKIKGIEAPATSGPSDPNFQVAMDLDLDAKTAVARARYVDGGSYTKWVETDPMAVPGAVIKAVKGKYDTAGTASGAVVGLAATTGSGDDSFAASWDWVEVRSPKSDGQVVYRWNGGTEDVAAIDGGPNWISDLSVVKGGNNTATHDITKLDPSVPGTTPVALFAQERWDGKSAPEMKFDFALTPGEYAIRLFMGDGFAGSAAPGSRVFDVRIEGKLFLDDLDLAAQVGPDVGAMFEWTGMIDDGNADINFKRVAQNPLVNGIEIVALGQGGAVPTVSALDASAGEGDGSVSVTINTNIPVPADDTVQVTYKVKPGGAEPKADYTMAGASFNAKTGVYTGTGEIGGGSADLTVPITLIDDSDPEALETMQFKITKVAGAGAKMGDRKAAVSIVDDDAGSGGASGGAATLAVKAQSDNVQISNFGKNSFVIANTGDKVITKVKLDVSGAILPDAVFDPFGLAGDTVSKPITIDTQGGTGVRAPNDKSYIGAGGKQGFEGIKLTFDPSKNGGFQPGEKVKFSADMDPNSIAGAKKSVLDKGTNPAWDAGGISGAELIGSSFTVTYADGSTSTGYLHSTETQGGSKGLSSQDASGATATLSVNGAGAGGTGTYDDGGPDVVVGGPAGSTVRVVMMKGFIQPVTNEFHKGSSSDKAYAPQLDTQLLALAKTEMPANNAVEFQTVDVKLKGGTKNVSSFFDTSGVDAFDFAGEDEVPLAFAAAVIDPANGDLPVGAVTDPIFLTYKDPASKAGAAKAQAGAEEEESSAPIVEAVKIPNVGNGKAGKGSTKVKVTYADEDGIDLSTIGKGDITVTGPKGELKVTGVKIKGDEDAPKAIYKVKAPGGDWNKADNGKYAVELTGKVADTDGDSVARDALGKFKVSIKGDAKKGPKPYKIEAEDFDILAGFGVKENVNARRNELLQASSDEEHRATHTMATKSGVYDLRVGHFDEDDGQSQLSVLVNGTEIDSFVWDRDKGGSIAFLGTFREHKIDDVELRRGDVVELAGFKDAGEPLRIDYVEFAYVDDLPA